MFHAISGEFSDTLTESTIWISLAINYPQPPAPGQLMLVCSMESEDDVLFYQTKDLYQESVKSNTWARNTGIFNLPAPKTPHDHIKIYVWNKENILVFLDEIKIKRITAE